MTDAVETEVDGVDQELGTLSQPLPNDDYPACSCVTSDAWRDTFIVPSTWQTEACRQFCGGVLGSTHAQAMCFTNGNFQQGAPGAVGSQFSVQPPANDACGWAL